MNWFCKKTSTRRLYTSSFLYAIMIAVFLVLSFAVHAQVPANDNCANASTITIGSGGFALGIINSTQFDMTRATVQNGEFFPSGISNPGLTKRSIWYKFSIPTTRNVEVGLAQPSSVIREGNVGFAVYKTSACLPGELQESKQLTPIAKFGSSKHPCLDAGQYYVQVSGNDTANGLVYITLTIAEPSPAPYDKPAGAQKFGKVNINKTTTIDFKVECQSIDNAAEICLAATSFKDFTKSTWHTFTTPDYFDWFSVLLAESNANNPSSPDFVVGYRLYEGDATTTPITSLLLQGGCDSIVANGYFLGKKMYKCGQLKTNTAYTIQLIYHKDFEKELRLGLAWEGEMPAKGPRPLSSLPVPNKMGILNADADGENNIVSDYFACNTRHSANSCPRSMPVSGVTGDNGYKYNLSTFYSFTLSTSASLTISAGTSYCGAPVLIRLYKQNLTANCADLDTANLVDVFNSYKSITCLSAGNYVLQAMAPDSTYESSNNYYHIGFLGTFLDQQMCLAGNLGRKVDVSIYAKTEFTSNRFSLNAAGMFDKINAVAGVMQPLVIGTTYRTAADTLGCTNTVLPDDKLCPYDTTKAVFREFAANDSVMVNFSEMTGHFMKLYKGDANALAVAQNKFSFPQRITGLTPYSNCIEWYVCAEDRNACATPGTYTLVSFGGENNMGQEIRNTITVSQPKTKHFTPATAQDMGSLWDSVALYGNFFYSDADTFSCRDNPATIGGFAPCEFNGKPATKLIYRQFYLSKPALVSISNVYSGCNSSRGVMTLFTGRAIDGLAGLKPVGYPWSCFYGASDTDPCKALPAGWYTIVTYGYGPGFADPLQGLDQDYQRSFVGAWNQIYITLAEVCTGPKFNRPFKASVDTSTRRPYLIQWGPQPGHTAAYPVTYKTYTLQTENFNCTRDTAFIRQYMQQCHADNVKVAFYVFETTQESFVQIDIPNDIWGAVYAFDVRTIDSIKLKTDQPLQVCLQKQGQIQICKLKPGIYTLGLLAPPAYYCNTVAPSIYVDQVGYSRFDHASKAYDFGVVRPDSIWHNGKTGDINPLNPGRAASNDFFYCTTGAQEKDPDGGVCGAQYNPAIYTAGNNIILHPDNNTTPEFYTIDRRNLWYTFTVNQGGTVRVKVDNKTPGKMYQYTFAVYQSDVDGSLPFASVVAAGSVDSTLLQGLTFIKNNSFYTYCEGLNEISFYNDPCSFKPTRYYILVENRNSYWYGNQMYPNHQGEVSVLLDSVNVIQPKFDHYYQANNIGLINGGKRRGALDNFTCATRDLPDPLQGYDCQKTLWYKFSTNTTGQVRYRAYYNNQSYYTPDQIQLSRQTIPGDSTANGLYYFPYTSATPDVNNEYWAQSCITPGTYYIILPGCNAVNENVFPEIEIIPQAGDFCSAPMITSLNGPGSKVVPVTVDCHTIGTDYGELNPTVTCPNGGITTEYKTSWFRLDIGGLDTLDVTVFINEKTNAGNEDIKYRMMTGNCGAMQEQSCVQDALTTNRYECMAPGNSYYIQVFTPIYSNDSRNELTTGNIDLNISAVVHQGVCLPANNCIARADFKTQFDCTKDREVIFINNSTFGSSIKYDWSFGYNNQKSNAVSPRFFYPALTTARSYTVKLVVSNIECGKKDSITQNITIPARPAVNLGKDTIVCTYGAILRYDATSHPGSTYYWYNGSTEPTIELGSTGSYSVEVTYNGCVARDTIDIWINPIPKQPLQTIALCKTDKVTLSSYRGYQELYKWNTGATSSWIEVSRPGYYWADLYLNGCTVRDSFLVVSTDLHPLGNDLTICQADMPYTADATVSGANSYSWQNGESGAVFNAIEPGVYWVDISLGGCTFRDSLTIKVDSFKTNAISVRICEGQDYRLPSGKAVSVAGNHTDTLKNRNGCDSIIIRLTLAVDMVKKINSEVSICAGQSYTLPSGKIVSSTNTYIDTVKNLRGCDSLISRIDLTVAIVKRENKSITLCKGQSYTLPSGKTVTTQAIYSDTLKARAGCDSLITIVDLKVLSPIIQSGLVNICSGKDYRLPSGKTVNTEGLHRDTIRYSNDCDSLISNITVTVVKPINENKKVFICEGSSYQLPSGKMVTVTNVYKDILRNQAGCDSLITTVDLTVQQVIRQNQNAILCTGQSYRLPSGRQVSETGVYPDTLRYTTGCDSLITITDIKSFAVKTVSSNVTICAGNSYTLPSGRNITTEGLHRDTIRYSNGCDSLISNITVTVVKPISESKNVFICEGSSYQLPSGKMVTVTNVYKDTLRNQIGCDSLITTVDLTVQQLIRQNQNAILCAGQSYRLPSGRQVSETGVYPDTLRYTTGCDSLITITDIKSFPVKTISSNDTICSGNSYTLPSGRSVNTEGLHRDTIRYSNGCDSLISNITITVVKPINESKKVFICEGSSYQLPSGKTVTLTNVYKDTLRNQIGCDSLITTVDLTVQQVIRQNQNAILCAGQNYRLPSGRQVSETGVYPDTLHYTTGCDSLITITDIKSVAVKTVSSVITICSGKSYTLPSGKAVDKNGLYRDTIRYVNGCDSLISIVTLNVTSALQEEKIAFICQGNSYLLPSGRIVSNSAVYRDTIRTVDDCDSLITIVTLNIDVPQQQILNAAICNGQTYILPSGRQVFAEGIYLDTLHNIRGCDSLQFTINLKVNNETRENRAITICSGQSYTLPLGKIVQEAGVFSDTLKTVAGCDSIITTAVTVRPALALTINAAKTICAGESTVITATASGGTGGPYIYTWEGITNNGNALTVNPSATTEYKLTVSDGCTVTSITDSVTINVVPLPDATIISDRKTGCSPLKISFNSNINNVNYKWDFGTGSVSDVSVVKSPSFTYQRPGSYTINLLLTTPEGCTNTDTESITVNATPVASVTGPSQLCAGGTSVFTGSADNTADIRWKWDFGNGNTSVLQNPPAQLFVSAGNYNISLITTNNAGCADTVNHPLAVSALPIPGLGGGETKICAGSGIVLNASPGITYQWSPASGLSSTTIVNPVANPANDTRYYVTMTNAAGCKATDSILVKVTQPFTLSVSHNTSVCAGTSVNLQASGALRYEWTGEGLAQTTGASVKATPTSSTSIYTVKGYGADNCFMQTATIMVSVVPLPTVEAGRDTVVGVGSRFTLLPVYSSDVTEYLWSPLLFLDCGNCPFPVTAPREEVIYTITVKNNQQCEASDTRKISLLCSNESVFVPNTFTPNGDGINDIFYPRGSGIKTVKYLRVYNRWGQLIFERQNFNTDDKTAGWDGTFKGQRLAPDVFVFTLAMVCDDNKVMETKGNIMIVR